MTQQQPPKPGRGRPEGRNAYGEATIPVRIPKSKITVVKDYLKGISKNTPNRR